MHDTSLHTELASQSFQWFATGTDEAKNVRLSGLRLLLVDDSPDNLKLFERVLTAAGAVVDLASDGASAIDKVSLAWTNDRASVHPYAAIIMDIRMPIIDGYEASRRIRAGGYAGPIIALTAHATPGEEERCRSAGCSHFYLKPIDRLGLLLAVRGAVDCKES